MIEKDRVVLVGDKSGALDPDKRNARTSKYTKLFFIKIYILHF